MGTDSGSAYVFNTAGTQLAKLLPTDGAADDKFGWSVSISGSTIVVGAFYDDDMGSKSGSAYVFNTAGTQLAKLLPSDGIAWDEFGVSVSISGSTIVVGAWFDDDMGSGSGSAYIFPV